ncbi:MAG: orotate phosphoribosyltransferase [Magnetococcales bacterium]|nr:orotate phosphoribosyltransferase [Magnetococcales bacterium]
MTQDSEVYPRPGGGQAETSAAFLRFALETDVLRFGPFQTKAGRLTPYFFNAGQFSSGASLARLGAFYADTLIHSGLAFDMLFGPAYKGIPLATATVTALALRHQRDVPMAYNRKESKDHGEGGTLIGAPLQGRVLVIDDVISAGTSVYESSRWIQQAGAQLAGVLIALDRQERGSHSSESAAMEVAKRLAVPVLAIARLEDLLQLLEQSPEQSQHLPAIRAYRARYGAG